MNPEPINPAPTNQAMPPGLHPIVPGKPIAGDWSHFPVPPNMEVGENTVIDSSASFRRFFSKRPVGLKLGSHVTIKGSSLATEEDAVIEIGDYSYVLNASLACHERISVGRFVYIASGVTIVDSDFHPVDPAARLADTVALSPVGDKSRRPAVTARPVVIEDEVWIGFNATILKGVRIGRGAVVGPGAVVLTDVGPGQTVMGNPAKPV